MTKYPLALLYLLLSAGLLGQVSEGANDWVVSLNYSPRFQPEITVENVRNETFPQEAFYEVAEVITIDGIDRRFQGAGIIDLVFTPTDRNLWVSSQLRLHRWLNPNFEFAGGFLYAQRAFQSKPANGEWETVRNVVSNFPLNYLIPAFEIRERSYGLTANLTYHFFPHQRFHPYVGAGIVGISTQQQGEIVGSFFTENLDIIIPQSETTPISNSNQNFDAYVVGGIVFQLTTHWGIGVEVQPRLVESSGVASFQLRYGW